MYFRFWLVFSFLLTACSAHATPHPEPYLEKEEIQQIINNTINALSNDYLFPDNTPKVIDRMRDEAERGEFTRGYHFGQFRQKFESILVNGTSDTGFELVARATAPSLTDVPVDAETNAIETELLDGNIGYLKLSGDFLRSDRRNDLTTSLQHLASADVLILDLRDVGAASMDFAQHLTSFFLPPGTIMATVSFNAHQAPISLTSREMPGFLHLSQNFPVFILTSGFVSGPWEFVSYTLKHYDAARLVGEDTMGVSYMKRSIPVSEHAALTLYYAQLEHPVTHDNWHQTGVFADYQVSATESFDEALTLASKSDFDKSN